jgi:hypothetical protein
LTGANTLTYSASSAAMKKKYTTLKPSINLIKLFIFVTDNENEKASAFLPFLNISGKVRADTREAIYPR